MTELVSEYAEGSHGRDAEYHGADEVAQCWLYQLVFLGWRWCAQETAKHRQTGTEDGKPFLAPPVSTWVHQSPVTSDVRVSLRMRSPAWSACVHSNLGPRREGALAPVCPCHSPPTKEGKD
jgi:hypothetical protein